MCGITGWFNSKTPLSNQLLSAMCKTIAHRGPNSQSQKILHTSNNEETGLVGLGHTRLSIIDVSDLGTQPMCDSSGRYWIVFNGEIYNYRQLRSTHLNSTQIAFKSQTDTEVLLYLYITYKEKCLELLHGMFAFVIYDSLEQTLFCARDRFGVKPFYYYAANGEFAFASEAKALYCYLNHTFSINQHAVSEFLIQGYISDNNSIATELKKLPPASYCTVNNRSEVSIKQYWKLNEEAIVSKQETSSVSEEKIAADVEEQLAESIKLRLVSDVPLGTFLSGGIDSSLVTILAQKILGKPIQSFCLGFNVPQFDEREYARDIAKHIGTEHSEMEVSSTDLLRTIPLLPKVYDEPFADDSAIPTLLLSEFTRKSVTVALSGDGGDEQFFGYTRYKHLLKIQQFYAIPKLLRSMIFGITKSFVNLDTITKLGAFTHNNFYQAAENIVSPFVTISNLWANSLSTALEPHKRNKSFFNENWLMLNDLHKYMSADVLTKVDRASMYYGLEARVPMLDHLFVENSYYNVPLYLKTGNPTKRILKNILRKYLPEHLIERPKKGFSTPLAQWVNGPLKDQIGDMLSSCSVFEEVLNFSEIRKQFNTTSVRQTKYGSLLFWKLFVLLSWEREYIK